MQEAKVGRVALAEHDNWRELSPNPAPDRFFNRELSWLEFNARVLAMAEDDTQPLLERVRFLAIFGRNMDEFFQIRVAGLMDGVAAGWEGRSPDGMTTREELAAVRERVVTLTTKQTQVYSKSVLPKLAEAGISLTEWDDLGKKDRDRLKVVFEERIFPILTPLSVDPAHPFPYISSLSLNLAIVVRDPKNRARRLARVKVPASLPRFLPLEEGEHYVPLEQVIAAHADLLFPGMELVAKHVFRVTRDADVDMETAEDEDLMSAIEEGVRRRDRSPEVVRLEVNRSMPRSIRSLLMEELELEPQDVYVSRSILGFHDLQQISDLDRSDLKAESFSGITQRRLGAVKRGERDIFSVIRDGDILVHHPYDSFDTSVATFVSQAARDPHVLAIKQTLYRTSVKNSPVVRALIRAAEAGKQAVAAVELRARFDEAANIGWARALEEAGVHVVYGIVGLKTHTKIALVVREEAGEIRRYSHVGTGNYHPGTATVYEDVGLLTADPDIAADVSDLFNSLTGYSRQASYRKILVSPLLLRPALLKLIAKQSKPGGRIALKMNSLVDVEMIEALYAASRAGAEIDLIVRGICCLRPGIPGQSDNIRVRSIIGRYLEHSRIFRFGGSEEDDATYLIGSADLMPRNLDHRVECVAPVEDPALKDRLEEILRVDLDDDVLAWELGHDGWAKIPTKKGISAHLALQKIAKGRNGYSSSSNS